MGHSLSAITIGGVEKLIIHTYFTNGMFEWAKFLLTTFKHFHGEEIPFLLSSRDLSSSQFVELHKTYKKMILINKPLDLDDMSKRTNVSKENLLKYKKEIETDHIKDKGTTLWKQLISVEDRYKNSILEAMDIFLGGKYMLHMDVDMYIRGHLRELFELITQHDISIRFRLKSKPNRRVQGGIIGFRLGDKAQEFMRKWIHYIDLINIKDKPAGYGQTSFYMAYENLKDKYSWGDVPLKFISPHLRPDDIIWSANSTKGKDKNLEIFKKDFEELKK